MVWETGDHFKVEPYQRLEKWYLMPLSLTLSIIRWGSRVKWSDTENGVAPYPTSWCSSYWTGAFRFPLTKVANFTYLLVYIYIYIYIYIWSVNVWIEFWERLETRESICVELWHRSKQIQTSVVLLHSLSASWEKYEPFYLPQLLDE